jgi:hypothetical protein
MSGTRVKGSADYIESAPEFSFIFIGRPNSLDLGPTFQRAVNRSDVCLVVFPAATIPLQLKGSTVYEHLL